MEKASTYDPEKFMLVVQELQKLKNQIFYLQQSFLQMRSESILLEDREESNDTDGDETRKETSLQTGTGADDDRVLQQLRSDIESVKGGCASKGALESLLEELREKEDAIVASMAATGKRLDATEVAAEETRRKTEESTARAEEVAARLDQLEGEAKKYNLIVGGLVPERRLERPSHLELLVAEFLVETLGVEEAHFDEAERVEPPPTTSSTRSPESPWPVVVRFPSVREKVRALSSSRRPEVSRRLRQSGITVREDFTERVRERRRRLAAFARRRARATKRKWALRGDELYFNGRVFVFDQGRNRVVPKRNLGLAAAPAPP